MRQRRETCGRNRQIIRARGWCSLRRRMQIEDANVVGCRGIREELGAKLGAVPKDVSNFEARRQQAAVAGRYDLGSIFERRTLLGELEAGRTRIVSCKNGLDVTGFDRH